MDNTVVIEKKYNSAYAGNRLIRGNSFVTASISLSATAYDVYLLALYKARNNIDGYGRPYATISSNEVCSITSRKDGNIYRKLKSIRDELYNLGIVVDDDKCHRFLAIHAVNICTYENGIFTIVFTPEILPFITELTSKYSSVDLGYMFRLNGYYAKRLYDLLKVAAYRIPKDNSWTQVRMELAHMRFSMGCIDIADMNAKEYMSMYPGDYAGLESVAECVKLRSYSNFKARALEPAIKQINACSDLDVRYKNACSGKGGKVHAIVFYIRRKSSLPLHETVVEDIIDAACRIDRIKYKPDAYKAVMDCMDERISVNQVKDLLEAADGDFERIKRAYALSQKQKNIHNLVAWLVSAIKNSYADARPIHLMNENTVGQEWEPTDRYIHNTEKQERVAKSVYEKKIQSSEFEDFLKYLDVTEYEFVQMYPTYDERVTTFFKWKVNKKKVDDISWNKGMKAIEETRRITAENGISGMALDEINAEISEARK